MHKYLFDLFARCRQLDPANAHDMELLLWAIQHMSLGLGLYLEPYAIEAWCSGEEDIYLWDERTLVGVFYDRAGDGIAVHLDPRTGESVAWRVGVAA